MNPLAALRSSTLLAIALIAAGCGKDSTGPGLTGDFTASITGGHTQSLQGDAFFSVGAAIGGAQEGFSLFLLEGSALGANHDFIIISREQAGRPPVGTYQLVDGTTEPTADKFVAIWVPATGEEVDGNFIGTGGTVTVTTSTSRTFAGTFTFGAIGVFDNAPETELEVTITGTFNAVFVDASAAVVTRITSMATRPATPSAKRGAVR